MNITEGKIASPFTFTKVTYLFESKSSGVKSIGILSSKSYLYLTSGLQKFALFFLFNFNFLFYLIPLYGIIFLVNIKKESLYTYSDKLIYRICAII
jgi:hypothetical protein